MLRGIGRKRGLIIILALSAIAVSYGFYFNFLRTSGKIVELPRPTLTGAYSFEECLVNLKDVREFRDEPLDIEKISQILWAAQGITDPVLKFRTAPSAGALYPLEVYAIVGEKGVNGLEKGVYHYLSEKHVLAQISREDLKSELATLQDLDDDRRCIEEAPVSLLITAVYERTTEKYYERGSRYVHLEAGCVAQNIYLQATALDLGATTIARFDGDSIQTLFGSPKPLLIMPIGKPGILSQASYNNSKDVLSDTDLIELTSPSLTGEISLERAIIKRRSIREYGPQPLTRSQISQILWAAGKTTAVTKTLGVRASAQIYLCVGEVSNLSEGVYFFNSHIHSLKKISEEDVREKLYSASGGELYPGYNYTYDWVLEGKVCLVLTAMYNASIGELGVIGERVAQFDVGMMAMNVHLQAAALDLGTVTAGAFKDHLILEALGIPRDNIPLFLMPIGHRTHN